MSAALKVILGNLAPDIFNTIDKVVVDKDKANELKSDLTLKLIEANDALVTASTAIIVAESAGEGWLQRSWRPLLMIWFAILIGAYWFGFTPVGMSQESVNAIFNLVQIGVGGYVVGRSVEKTASIVAPLINRK